MHRHTMKSGAGDLHVHQFSSDDVAQRDRLAFMREVVLRKLPDLGPASTDCSGIHAERRAAQIDSDDLVLHITLAGRRIVRQFGRDTVVCAGELAVTRSFDAASSDCDPGSRLFNIRIPVSALAPMIVDLDAALVRVIPADTEPLPLLVKYAGFLQTTDALQQAGTRQLIVAHVYDLVALATLLLRSVPGNALLNKTFEKPVWLTCLERRGAVSVPIAKGAPEEIRTPDRRFVAKISNDDFSST
jgi:AraC-binding-like domain